MGKLIRRVREGADGKGPVFRAPRRRPTSLGRRARETHRWKHRQGALVRPHLDALRQAQSALNASPRARAYYGQQRNRGVDHSAALRQLANRLVGILHGCLKTRTLYDDATAWPLSTNKDQQAAA